MSTDSEERFIRQDTFDHNFRVLTVACITVGLVGLLFGITLWVGTAYHSDQQREQYRQQTAQHCVDAGNFWINGNCIPKGK